MGSTTSTGQAPWFLCAYKGSGKPSYKAFQQKQLKLFG